MTLRVIPFDAGSFPGAGQTVVYLEGPVPRLDTVQIEVRRRTFVTDITWEDPFCAEGSACFRLGTNPTGNAYLTDSRDALRTMILDIKAGKADHLL